MQVSAKTTLENDDRPICTETNASGRVIPRA